MKNVHIDHHLKIYINYLVRLLEKVKKNEIRLNDRDYQAGDRIVFAFDKKEFSFLKKYKPNSSLFGVYSFKFRITHIHSGLGLKDGYVSLSVERIEE